MHPRIQAASRTGARLAVAGLVLSVLLATSVASAATKLRDGFEAGKPTGWSSTSGINVGTFYAKQGTYGARAVSKPGQAGYLSWTSNKITQGMRYGRISGWVNIRSFKQGETVGIMNLKNGYGLNHFDMWRDVKTGKFRYDLYSKNNARSTMVAKTGRWYFVEVLVDFGGQGGDTYTARVRINGIAQPKITSTSQTGTTVRGAWFGARSTAKTNTRFYDSLAVSVGSQPFSFTR